MRVLASGDFLGGARFGDAPEAAAERVAAWLERAVALGSPILRVTSSFYRADLGGIPGAIEAERLWAIEALGAALPAARDAGVTLALENHSDFTAAEYRSILEAVADERAAMFLDVINPVAALEDPVPVVEQLAPLRRGRSRQGLRARVDPQRRRLPPPRLLGAVPLSGRGRGRSARRSGRRWRRGWRGRELPLAVEGLDNRGDVRDQVERLRGALRRLRELVPAPAGA